MLLFCKYKKEILRSIFNFGVFLFINYRQEIKNMYNFVIFLNYLYHNVTFLQI